MVNKRRLSLSELQFVGEVIDKVAQKQIIGGYQKTSKGYYVFTYSELEKIFGSQNQFPSAFGEGRIGCTNVEGQKSELFYKISNNDFDRLFENGYICYGVYGGGGYKLDELLGDTYYNGYSSWSYGSTPNSGYYYDPFDEIGSYYNPYSKDEYERMVENGTWMGGFVFGKGYAFVNSLCVNGTGPMDLTSFGDLLGNESALNSWINDVAQTILSFIPVAVTLASVLGPRLNSLMGQVQRDTSYHCMGDSQILVVKDFPKDNSTVMRVRVYTVSNARLVADYSLMMDTTIVKN